MACNGRVQATEDAELRVARDAEWLIKRHARAVKKRRSRNVASFERLCAPSIWRRFVTDLDVDNQCAKKVGNNEQTSTKSELFACELKRDDFPVFLMRCPINSRLFH